MPNHRKMANDSDGATVIVSRSDRCMTSFKFSAMEPRLLLTLTVLGLALSGIACRENLTWFLEVVPVFVGIALLVPTYRSFPLTPLVYRCLAIHAVLLMVGGHYTYAEVPVGFWVRDVCGWTRNPYDRLGHFVQGFVPALLAREILRRRSPLPPGKWLFFLTTCVCLAFSASYELIEWWVAIATGGATAFLGTQGDPWDTQWDMFLALVGALSAQLALQRHHDRALSRLVAVLHR